MRQPSSTISADPWFVEQLISALLWCQENPLATLTAVLVFVTGYYAWATHKTLQWIERDFRFRIRPFVVFDLSEDSYTKKDMSIGTLVTLKLRSIQASAHLLDAFALYVGGTGTKIEHELKGVIQFQAAGRVIPVGENKTFEVKLPRRLWWAYFRIFVRYEDVEGLTPHEESGASWFSTGQPRTDEVEKYGEKQITPNMIITTIEERRGRIARFVSRMLPFKWRMRFAYRAKTRSFGKD